MVRTLSPKALILWFFLASAPAFAASFQPLGDLPGTVVLSKANAISADGCVVVGFGTLSVPGLGEKYKAFRWTANEGMLGLGSPLEHDLTIPQSDALAVSGDGSLTVGYVSRDDHGVAVTWNAMGRMSFLDGIFPRPALYSGANDISDDGSTIVGSVRFSPAVNEAFVWNSGTGVQLLTAFMPSMSSSRALAVSPDGRVVLGAVADAAGQEAFRWTADSGLIRLGDLPGAGLDSTPSAASYDGSVIVGDGRSANSLGELEAFRWTAQTGIVGLGDLPGGDFGSSASDVSADGRTIVGASMTEFGGEAFIWDAEHGMRNLREVLVGEYGLGNVLEGWRLGAAQGISADGMAITGAGYNPNGEYEAWLVRLDAAPVPEPTTIALAASAALVVLASRPRRRG